MSDLLAVITYILSYGVNKCANGWPKLFKISKSRKAIKLHSPMKEKLKHMTLCDDNKNEIKKTPIPKTN